MGVQQQDCGDFLRLTEVDCRTQRVTQLLAAAVPARQLCHPVLYISRLDLAPAQMPLHYYFCREVATNGTRNALRQYALPTRRYLGPTSMDAEMAFLMCNQARVRFTQRHDRELSPTSSPTPSYILTLTPATTSPTQPCVRLCQRYLTACGTPSQTPTPESLLHNQAEDGTNLQVSSPCFASTQPLH